LTVEINRASGALGATPATALDWTAAVAGGVSVVDAVGTAHPILFTGDLLRAKGSAHVDLFGFVSGDVDFAFERRSVDADLNGDGTRDLTDASLTTLYLDVSNLFIGVNGVGFTLSSG